jgi:Ca-activated chloride channel family protein
VLWSLERHAPVPLDQLRPHEFLNWFAFRHEAPAPDAPFAIHGEARELEGSTLSLALAVTATEGRRRPLDLTLILDRSGSMQESGRLDYLKRGLLLAADRLQPGDRVDMVVFDGSVCTPVEGWVVGRDDPTLLRRAIEAISPTGSTNLAAGLREGYRVARAHLAADPPGVPRNRRAMLVTDALLNTGDVDEALVSDIGAAFEEGGIRLTGVGVGREFNDSMLDRLTEKGHGVYVFMGSVPSVDRIFGEGFDRLTRTVAEDVRIALSLPRSLGMQRFYGEEMSVDPADVQPVNVQAGATQLFLEDLRFRGGAPDPAAPLQVDIAWTDPDTGERSAWRWASTVGEVLANGSANVDKGRALMAFTDMIVEDGVSGGYCKAARAELLRRAEVAHDPDVDRLVTLAGDRCTRAPVAWRDPYTEARALQAPAGMISLCAAPPPPATAFGVSRFAPPTFASPRSGCGPSAELGPIR